MEKTALISGYRGQDSTYLSELLLSKGYTVVGFARRIGGEEKVDSAAKTIRDKIIIEQGDITDFGSVGRLVAKYKPDEFYNLAAQSFVAASWDEPISTCQINFVGTCNCLEAVRLFNPTTRFFQASTSEVYGDVITNSQNEETPARPRSPYAAAKYGAESLVKVYRESYNLYASYARSFNHESALRPAQFVTRKITSGIAKMTDIARRYNTTIHEAVKIGVAESIKLGNIDAKRDWSHARDIVRGIWMMMQQNEPDDYVFASGTTRSIREFLDTAFGCVGVKDWSDLITIDQKFFRPADVNILTGDCTKATEKLGWRPEISFESLVKEMVAEDLKRLGGIYGSR